MRQAPCLLNPQTRLCLALEQSHKRFLLVLNQSLRVSQSHATELIPASSISSGELLSGETGCATSLYMSQGSQNTSSSSNYPSMTLPRILLVLSRFVHIPAKLLVLSLACDLPSCLITIFKLFTKHLQNRLHQYWIARIQQSGLLQISIPSFLCTFFKVSLQSYFDSPTVQKKYPLFSTFSLDSDRICEHSDGMFMNIILVDSFPDECLLGCSCSQQRSAKCCRV